MPELASYVDVEDLDAAETLAAAEAAVRDRRAAEVRELEIALHWADLHAHDPR
jgi:multidrug efflux pump subunit AcrA (membrane-fusion protein)